MRRKAIGFVVTSLIIVAFGGVVSAEAPNGAFRFFVTSINPTGDVKGNFGSPITATVEADSTVGFGFVYEGRISRLFGIEVGLFLADVDFEIEAVGESAGLGSALMVPLTLGLDVHVLKSERVDLYVGPLMSFTLWSDLQGDFGTSELDADFGLGGVVGLDVLLGQSSWTFSSAVRYIEVSAGDSSMEIPVDPMQWEFGFGHQF